MPRNIHANAEAVKAFEATLGRASQRWKFESVVVKLQTDSSSCGVRILVVNQAFVAYVDSSLFLTGSFPAFLVSWLGAEGRGVADLTGLGVGGTAQRKVQIAHNLAFIQEERRQLCERLRAAANDDVIELFAGAQLEEFVAPGATAATAVDLEQLDPDD